MIGLGLLDPCSVLGLTKDYPSENLAQNWTIQQLGYVRRWAKKAEKLMDETGKFCQATLQWANSSVVASRPSTRYPLSGRIFSRNWESYSVKSNDRFVRDFLVLGMNSDCVWKDWFKVGNAPTFKEVRDMAKSEESADKQLQLMSTEVCSINVPKRYQCQANQRPTSNTGSSKLQACRNCGWGTHPWEQCPVKNVTCHFCQN